MKIFRPLRLAAWVSLMALSGTSSGVLAESVAAFDRSKAPSSQLSSFINNSLTGHPDILAAKADVLSASAALRASGQAIYNPEISYDYEDIDVKTQIIGISQTIDWGDQRGSRRSVSQAQLEMAQASYKMTIQSFMSGLLEALAENQTEKELALLSDETLNLMLEFREIAQRRYQAGDLNLVELNLAKLAFSQALMEQANVRSNATEALENLRAILGDLPLTLPGLPELLPEPNLEKDLSAFLQQLPIIRTQLAQVQVARKQVAFRQSEKAWDPTLSFSSGSEGSTDLIGFNLSIPIKLRNTYSAEVDVANQDLIASEQRAQLAYRNTRATLVINTERYRNLLNAWNSWRETSRDSVKQQLKLIKQLWQAGDISASDYLLQLKQALETQATGLQLRNQLWHVAFAWMGLTNSLDNWLNIQSPSPLLEKN